MTDLLRLGAPRTARAIDRALDLEAEAERARKDAMDRVGARMRAETDPVARRGWRKQLKELRRAGLLEVDAARADARRSFADEQPRLHEAMREIAGDARFREAVSWQNRAAVTTALDALLAGSSGSDGRKHERLVAKYLQRYCAKADTIGFFGPVGWGRFGDDGPALAFRAGAELLAERKVFFEYWAIDALAQAISALPGIKPWLAPRRLPTVCVDRIVDIVPEAARLLAECDGVRPARALTSREGYGLLGELAARGLILWTLEVPVGDLAPERWLRRAVEAIDDDAIRGPALAMLAELEHRRDAVARAAGDAAALGAALDDANQTFTRLTGRSATRHGGQTYAGRTILYEDCRRDLELSLGPELVRGLAGAMELVATSARWFVYTVCERMRGEFAGAYRGLRAGGSAQVDYLAFWKDVASLFAGGSAVQTGKRSPIAQEVEVELQARWSQLFAIEPEQRCQTHASDRLRDAARAAFEVPHAGARFFVHHAPDLCIAATSPEAVARGDCYFVLSELHPGVNTNMRPIFIELCPHAAELLAARKHELPDDIFPVLRKDMHLRFSPSTFGTNDTHYETAEARSFLPREHVLAVADLYVEEVDDRLWVHHRRDGRVFDIVDFLAMYILRASIQSFTIAPQLPHTPRLVIDKLVVARETWRVATASVGFVAERDDADRFIGARRWARTLGLPRFVFVKTPEEKKPIFIDLESPVYVDILARMLRVASRAVFTEMLPGIGESWLTDQHGRTYVSELRVTLADRRMLAGRS